MIEVRTDYQVRFGKTDQAVDLFKRLPDLLPASLTKDTHYHLLTDISGPMYTLVEEMIVPSLADWESIRPKLFNHPDYASWFRDFQLFVEEGVHQFFNIEGECEDWSRPGVIVVRQNYRARQWQIGPTVELLQRYGALMVDSGAGRQPRILTDVSGPMFQAVIEVEADDLAEWERNRRKLFGRPEFQLWFVQLTGAVESGTHEFYRVEG